MIINDVRHFEGTKGQVFYLPGHKNTFAGRNSHIAVQVETVCAANQLALTHMAYYGWEQSSHPDVPSEGEGYIRHWMTQALEVLDQTTGPQILVGYSMGGPMALQLARLRPQRVQALIGLACGFGVGGQGQATHHYGNANFVTLNGVSPLTYTSMGTEMAYPTPLELTHPLYLLHGQNDEWVSWKNTLHLAAAWSGNQVSITLEKGAGHGLRECDTSSWLGTTLTRAIHAL